MMADGAGDEVVTVGIGPWYEKLCHAIAHGSALDVFAKGPPAIIIDLAEVVVGAVEQRDVPSHPTRGFCIRDGGYDVFVLHRIEMLGIMGEVVVPQDGSRGIGIERTGGDTCNTEGCHLGHGIG